MKATEQYIPVVLFIMLYNAVPTFEYVNEILQCDHSNESYGAKMSCCTVYYPVQGGNRVPRQFYRFHFSIYRVVCFTAWCGN